MKKIGGRLGVILGRKNLTLRKLARIANRESVNNTGNIAPIDPKNTGRDSGINKNHVNPIDPKNDGSLSAKFTEVLQGKRNTARYVELLERTLELDIETIRNWYREDRGRKMSLRERMLFADELDGDL